MAAWGLGRHSDGAAMKVRAMLAVLAVAVIASAWQAPDSVATPDGEICYLKAAGVGFGGAQGVMINGVCHPSSAARSPAPPTKVINCGSPNT